MQVASSGHQWQHCGYCWGHLCFPHRSDQDSTAESAAWTQGGALLQESVSKGAYGFTRVHKILSCNGREMFHLPGSVNQRQNNWLVTLHREWSSVSFYCVGRSSEKGSMSFIVQGGPMKRAL